MSEMAKTIVFAAVAAAALLFGFVVNPGEESLDVDELVGERLNDDFDVEAPKRLKIVKFDRETAETRQFEVALEDGLWTIPSKQGYPADATRQMAEAATCVMDRLILKVAATSASEHQQLGVVDPTASNLGSNAEGVGTRIVMTDANDEKLVDMIIGKAVKETENQHFVRNADQDVVYVVELDPDKLSTQFDDWIEDDLLQMNPFDIRRVQIKDYTATLQPVLSPNGTFSMQVDWDRRAEMALRYDNSSSKWEAESLREFDAQQKDFADRPLAEDEELNEDSLRELRNGLDDLLLVDVERKPAGLSADLKAGSDFLNNNEAVVSLVERGFAPLTIGEQTEVDILSSEGEVVCTLDDGVEYLLRFGNLKMDGEASSEEKPDSEGEAQNDSAAAIHRYLFVMARFNGESIEKPQLDELPELPENTAEESPASDNAEGDAATDEPAAENPAPGESASADESETKDADPAEDANDSVEQEDASEDADFQEDESENLESIIAERKAIEEENQRRLDDYQEKIKSGKERVQELNERFGDWYYVISNDVYKQIHLNLDQVVRKKEKTEEDASSDSEESAESGDDLPGLPNLPLDDAGEQ